MGELRLVLHPAPERPRLRVCPADPDPPRPPGPRETQFPERASAAHSRARAVLAHEALPALEREAHCDPVRSTALGGRDSSRRKAVERLDARAHEFRFRIQAVAEPQRLAGAVAAPRSAAVLP
ncbi:MAG: hypothetical protein ACXWIH_06555, partial [Burkholderiales bacterium]